MFAVDEGSDQESSTVEADDVEEDGVELAAEEPDDEEGKEAEDDEAEEDRKNMTESELMMLKQSEYRDRLVEYRSGQQWTEIMSTWMDMQREEIDPDLVSYNAIARGLLATNQSFKLLSMLRDMRIRRVMPNEDTYSSAIYACGVARNSTLALALFREAKRLIKAEQLRENVYQSALYACMRCGDWQNAVSLFREARELSPPVTQGILKYALVACCRNGQLELANRLLQEAEQAGDYLIRGTQFTLLIAACEERGRWKEVLALAARMGAYGTPDAITCCSVLKACREVGQWEPAISILQSMRTEGLKPDSYAYSMVIDVCAGAKQYEQVIRIFEDSQIDLLQNETKRSTGFGRHAMGMAVAAINALIQMDRVEEATALCRKAIDRGWLQVWRWQRFRLRLPFLDLAGLPPQVAKIASRLALEDLASDPDGKRRGMPRILRPSNAPLEDLRIIVAREENEEEGEETVAGAVLQMVQELCGPAAQPELDLGPPSIIRVPAAAVQSILLTDVQRALAGTAGTMSM